jgi:hypothetical protein
MPAAAAEVSPPSMHRPLTHFEEMGALAGAAIDGVAADCDAIMSNREAAGAGAQAQRRVDALAAKRWKINDGVAVASAGACSRKRARLVP